MCILCKLEAAFKTKRGSRVCRRCDYCLKNYGKPKACEKCKVKAAWDGAKIEKINGMVLCYLCAFREKRKSKIQLENGAVAKNDEKVKNKENSTETPNDENQDKPKPKEKPKKPVDPTVIRKRFYFLNRKRWTLQKGLNFDILNYVFGSRTGHLSVN